MNNITRQQRVSIHAPRAGRDIYITFKEEPSRCFNPRAPCGARPKPIKANSPKRQFQSTRPVRGATRTEQRIKCCDACFNPRAPCGARPMSKTKTHFNSPFQSTRPVRGATMQMRTQCLMQCVSIHAPRAGRDWRKSLIIFTFLRFNPRAPCGARRSSTVVHNGFDMFQSTRPVRGATQMRL